MLVNFLWTRGHVGRSCSALAPYLPLVLAFQLQGACVHQRLLERQEPDLGLDASGPTRLLTAGCWLGCLRMACALSSIVADVELRVCCVAVALSYGIVPRSRQVRGPLSRAESFTACTHWAPGPRLACTHMPLPASHRGASLSNSADVHLLSLLHVRGLTSTLALPSGARPSATPRLPWGPTAESACISTSTANTGTAVAGVL